MRELGKVASELELTVGQLALSWILRQPNVSSADVIERIEPILES